MKFICSVEQSSSSLDFDCAMDKIPRCRTGVFLCIIAFLPHRRLFNYLKSRYSEYQLVVLNRVLRARGRWNSIVLNIRFLKDCLDKAVAPKGIQQRVRKSKAYLSAAIERSFLKDELVRCRTLQLQARRHFNRLFKQANDFLGWFDYIRFSWLISECDRKQRSQLSEKNSKTIERLRQYRYGIVSDNFDNIVNLAGIELTTLEKEVLCRGVDFGVPPRISVPEVLAEFEILQQQLSQFTPVSKTAAEKSKCDLAALAHEFVGVKPDLRDFCLRREHRKALKELRMSKDLIIVKPDKGRATVLMTRQDYISKMMTILQDESKFVRLGPCQDFDRTLKIEQNLQCYLKQLVDSKEIVEETYAQLRPVGSARPRLYGLPKTHKPGVPLRPILSMTSSPQYAISQWLSNMLKPVVKYYGKYCVKDSFTFSDLVKTSRLSPSGFMCSFDVVSLFTNVPLEEVIEICANSIYHNDNIDTEPTSLSEKSFRDLLRMVTSGVEFSFDDIMYRQIDGVAMGSPLGPILANIFVGFYEDKIPREQWPEMYSRYVDDIFSHFVSKAASIAFGEQLNSLHPALRFTREDETNGTLPHLDVMVTRTADRQIVTSVYRKRTFTGMYTRWDSFSPTRYKIALVRSLAHRARRICSPCTIENEFHALRSIFMKNGYPGHILDEHLQLCPPSPSRFIGPKPCLLMIRLPWIGAAATSYERRINQSVRLAYFAAQVRPAYNTNRAFNLPKDVLPTPSLSNVIYQFECRHCESRYVGKTSQHLSERIDQHVPKHLQPASAAPKKRGRGRPRKNTDKPASERYQSAIACHLAESADCRESFSRDTFTVLSRARSRYHLNILEAIHINLREPVLCRQKAFVTSLRLFSAK